MGDECSPVGIEMSTIPKRAAIIIEKYYGGKNSRRRKKFMLYTCEICGRQTERGYKAWGYTLCSKHMHQYHKYKRFLDNNPRTQQDLNDYRIEGNIAIFDLYNHGMIKDAEFIIDAEDVDS